MDVGDNQKTPIFYSIHNMEKDAMNFEIWGFLIN